MATIEFMDSIDGVDLWALRRRAPHLFELVRVIEEDGREMTVWQLRSEARKFFEHPGDRHLINVGIPSALAAARCAQGGGCDRQPQCSEWQRRPAGCGHHGAR
jgi:hypothetical protein